MYVDLCLQRKLVKYIHKNNKIYIVYSSMYNIVVLLIITATANYI